MRIGIDLQVLGQKHLTGVGKYALNITRALLALKSGHEFVWFVPESVPLPQSLPLGEGKENINNFSPLGGGGKVGGKEGKGEVMVLPRKKIPFFTTHWQYARIMQKAKLDVLFGPANILPWFYKPLSPSPQLGALFPRQGRVIRRMTHCVITLHDLAIYKHPEWFPRGQWFSTKLLVPRSIKKASRIIVPSQTTARDLKELFDIPEQKIAVIPHGVEERFFPANAKNTKEHSKIANEFISRDSRTISRRSRYILFVGTLEPRKNVQRLIEAYSMLPEDIKAEYELWIAGNNAPLPHSYLKRGEGELKGIKFLGYVPDEDLPALYQGATVFVYPSLYEGFGLPVLEAMAAGVPVITSRGTAMEEIITNAKNTNQDAKIANAPLPYPLPLERGRGGEGIEVSRDSSTLSRSSRYGLLVDPYSPSEIALAIAKLIRDNPYLSQISKVGQELARHLTWERAARETLKAITNF